VQRIVGRLSGKVSLSLMARSEYVAKAKQGQSTLRRRSATDRWILSKIPDSMRVVRSKEKQEESAEEENRSQLLDPCVVSDHHWIGENLHGL
jgi:hypothetical protein